MIFSNNFFKLIMYVHIKNNKLFGIYFPNFAKMYLMNDFETVRVQHVKQVKGKDIKLDENGPLYPVSEHLFHLLKMDNGLEIIVRLEYTTHSSEYFLLERIEENLANELILVIGSEKDNGFLKIYDSNQNSNKKYGDLLYRIKYQS